LDPDSIDVGLILLGALTPDPFGRAVWFIDPMYGHILQRAIQNDGSLGTLGQNELYNATIFPASFAADPTGTYAYSGAPGSISLFYIAEDRGLTLAPNNLTTSWVAPIAVDGAGRYLYAGARNPENKLLQYSIGSDGVLIPLTPASVATDVNPISIALSP
jgi:hypothetical protein